MSRALPRIALQLWIVLFIVFFGAEVIHLEPGLRIATQLAYGVPLAVWALLRLRGPYDRLDIAALGMLVVYGIVCFFSRDRTESLGTLALVTAYVTWFLLMRRVATSQLRRSVTLAAATGFAITLAFNAYLLVQEKIGYIAEFGAAPWEGLMTFPWESVNALPVLVLLAIPFISRLTPGWTRTSLATIVGASAIVVVPLSMGRAGWLALAVAAVVLILQLLQRRLASVRPAIRVAAALGVVALGLVAVGPRLVTALSESGRLLLWDQGLTMAASAAAAGSGPGSYPWARLEFGPPAADLLAVRLLHNAPIQTLADGGLVLAGAVIVAIAVLALTIMPTWHHWSPRVRIARACLIGFAAALLLDDFSYLPAITISALTVAAFLAPVRSRQTRVSVRRWGAPLALLAAAAVSLPSVVAVDLARGAAQSGRTAMVAGDYADAAAGFEAATRAHPENGGYWLGLGMAHSYARADSEAVAAYERAVAAAPGDPRGYAGLAHFAGGEERIALLRSAAERTFGDPQYAVRLGIELVALGRTDQAIHAWGRAVALHPPLLRLLPYDRTGIAVEDVAEQAKLTILAEPRPAPIENLIDLWDIGLALNDLPSDAALAWRAVDAARDGDFTEATELARAAIVETPYDALGYQAMAAVAAFACDEEAERKALADERRTPNAYGTAEPEPHARREFIYREASLGPSQPPGATPDIEIERWPWPLVARPACAS
jgi:tetratricopeptide (TPR) repeat protein